MADVPGTKTDDEILAGVPGIDDGDAPAAATTDPAAPTDSVDPAAAVTADPAVGDSPGVVKDKGTATGPGDLLDGQGQVVAKGGAERRLFEQAQRVGQENTTLKARVSELEGQIKAVADAGSIGTQLNLTPEEVTSGAQIMSAYKENPIETIKYLLTQAQASGHNTEGIGAGTDVSAIKKMLSDAMQPFVDERNERIDTQERRSEAEKVYNDFIARHPDASVHQDAIARLLETDKTLNAEAAYLKLRLFYQTKGLDWTKNLAELQKAVDPAAGDGKGTQTTLPAGNMPASAVTDTAQVASVDTSLDDIIRDSMKEAGIQSQ